MAPPVTGFWCRPLLRSGEICYEIADSQSRPTESTYNGLRNLCFFGVEATALGRRGSTAIKRKPGKKYAVTIERTEWKNVAKETRHMPDEFINQAGNDVTPAFTAYAKPIVGDLPKIGRLKAVKVAKP